MKPLHFLLTDDDPDKRLLLNRALTKAFPDASIFECHSGREALDYFSANHVDAVITNHSMAPINGLELVREIRRRGSSVPIIMVSGHEEVKQQAENAGVDLFVTGDWRHCGKTMAEFLNRRGIFDKNEFTKE